MSQRVTNEAVNIEYYDDHKRITNFAVMVEYDPSAITTLAVLIEYTLLEDFETLEKPPASDVYLDSGSPTDNTGWSDSLSVSAGDTKRKSLLRFDLKNVEAPSEEVTLIGARVKLTPEGNYDSDTYNLYWVSDANGDWLEGEQISGEGASGEPSWNYKNTGEEIPWAGSAGLSTPDTDYDSDIIGTVTTDTTEGEAIYITLNGKGIGLIKDKMLGKETNNGMLMANENGADNRNFKAKGSGSDEPNLELTFGAKGGNSRILLLGVG